MLTQLYHKWQAPSKQINMTPCSALSGWWMTKALSALHRSQSISHKIWTQFVVLYFVVFISSVVNSFRPRQNRPHFADNDFKYNFLNENVWILIKVSLKFVPKGPINHIPALVQIMAWCRTGNKPLSEPMMTQFNDAYMRHLASMSW